MKNFLHSFFGGCSRITVCGIIALLSSSLVHAQIAWPLNPSNQIHRIFCGYGNYDDGIDGTGQTTGKDLHFHEGLDLLPTPGVAQNNNVIASENGTVQLVNSIPQNAANGNADGYLNHILISRGNSTTEALIYMHCTVGLTNARNLQVGELPRMWKKGDAVVAGDVLGTIAVRTGLRAHLHFGWQSKKNAEKWFVFPPQGVVEYAGNPIDLLAPKNKNNKPVVDSSFYMTSAGVRLTTKLYNGKLVINNNVDIAVKAYDRFGPANTDVYDINVKKLEWSAVIINQCACAAVPTQTPINFTGKFLAANPPSVGRNLFSKFHNVPLLHTIYSNKSFAKSKPRNVSATYTNAGRYYMYLTNIDQVNESLETTDAAFYWNTKAKETSVWNAQQAANTADSNKIALTPDGLYQIAVKATGHAGVNDITSKYDTVLINNFNEVIISCSNTGAAKDTFCTGDPLYIKGKGFPKFFTFTVSVVKHRTWPDGTVIPTNATRVAVAEVSSDGEGRIPPTMIWNAYAPNGSPDAGYEIVLDYDGDATYSTPKLNFVVDPIDKSIGGTVGIIGSNLKATSTRKHVSCYGKCDGKITITATGGKPPYQYYYEYCCPGPRVRDSLCAGTYITTVIDALGCRFDVFDTITEPPLLKLQKTSTNVTCKGKCDGTITLSATGGTAPYTFTPSKTQTGLCAGWVYVSVKDKNGCVAADSVLITEPTALTLDLNKTNLTCFGVCNGFVSATASGGTPPYSFSPAQFQTGLCAGTYSVTVTDAAGCTKTLSTTITQPPSFTLSAGSTNTSCGACNGTVSASASGGTPPYNYFPAQTQTNLCAGSYTVTAVDSNGCTASQTVTVNQDGSSVFLSGTATNDSCNTCRGSISVSASGGFSPYTYSPSSVLTNLCAGSYTVSVTDAKQCTTSQTFTVLNVCDTIIKDTSIHSGIAVKKDNNGNDKIHFVSVKPNPFTESIQVDFYAVVPGVCTYRLISMNGSVVLRSGINSVKGINSFSISKNSNIVPGTYIIELESHGAIARQRVIKL